MIEYESAKSKDASRFLLMESISLWRGLCVRESSRRGLSGYGKIKEIEYDYRILYRQVGVST